MRASLAFTGVFLVSAVLASGQDKKDEVEKGIVILEIAVAGMKNPETDPAEVKAALEGKGVSRVVVDAATKRATVEFAPDKTRSSRLLGQLRKAASKKYARSRVERLRAELDAEWALVTAEGEVSRQNDAIEGVLTITIERKGKHAIWGKGNGNVDPEIDVRPAVGFTAKRVPPEDKADRSRVITYAVAGETLPRDELGIDVEIKLKDVADKETKSRVVKLVVPVKVNAP